MENRINDLKNALEDDEIVKSIMLNNPFMLSDDDVLSTDYIIGILTEADFEIDEQKHILEENPHIFDLTENMLERSINMMIGYFQNMKDFKKAILADPKLIGIADEKNLEESINGSEMW